MQTKNAAIAYYEVGLLLLKDEDNRSAIDNQVQREVESMQPTARKQA
jgi:hypothetical protein